jgi:adenine-specific DNA-methyltransferase
MHPEASIYVHCDWRVNSFIRLAMDEVFGRNNFVNELIWKRRTGYMGTYNRYGAITDNLLW